LTSSSWGRPLSALWGIRRSDMKFALDDEEHVEFSKVSQDRIVATKLEVATVSDSGCGSGRSRNL
jgi:HIV-1 Vpr-binding protein